MKTVTKIFELQIDDKPRGAVIRLNDENGCVVRVCGVPREMVYDEQDIPKDNIDITFPFENIGSLRGVILQRLAELGGKEEKYSRNLMRWRNFFHETPDGSGVHISKMDFTILTDEELIKLYERVIRQCSKLM